MHVQDRDARSAVEHHGGHTLPSTLQRIVETVAGRLRPKPDLSLMNEKFSDSFEREHADLLLRNRW